MLLDKQRHYSVFQSFASRTENEYEVYDYNQNRVGYIVENTEDNSFEIYHNATADFDDYSSIDYTDNYDDALNMIISEIEYDMN